MSIFRATASGLAARGTDRAELERACLVLFSARGCHEVRGLPSGRSRVCATPRQAADAAEAFSDDRGVYYTLNPVTLPAGATRAARVGDVACRRWLLVDVDPVKAEPDGGATDQEKGWARLAAANCWTALYEAGWPAPVMIDSGNGYHLLWRVDLPNDEASRVLLRQCLRALAARYDGEGAKIDKAVHNAGRISKLPGTWARKGADTKERPHRMCRLVHAPPAPQPVPLSALQALAAEAGPAPKGAARGVPPASPFRPQDPLGWDGDC